MINSAYDELQKNQSAILKGELATGAASGLLSAVKDGGAAKDWGAGSAKLAYFTVTAAAAWNPGTSANVQIIGADNLALTTNPVVLADSGALPVAGLTAGSLHRIGVLASGVLKRFLGAKWIATGGNPTTGALVVALIPREAAPAVYGDLTNSLQ